MPVRIDLRPSVTRMAYGNLERWNAVSKGVAMGTLGSKIQQVFNEPGCATNQAKPSTDRKKGCNKLLAPGAAAGGCAFDGAKIALQPITDVVHLVHGPINCEGHSFLVQTRECVGTAIGSSLVVGLTEISR